MYQHDRYRNRNEYTHKGVYGKGPSSSDSIDYEVRNSDNNSAKYASGNIQRCNN